jgi:hypothetical protein
MYLEREARDDVDRVIVVETEIMRPTQPVAVNSAYSLWSIYVTDATRFTIGAEIDGVSISTTDMYSLFDLPLCAN